MKFFDISSIFSFFRTVSLRSEIIQLFLNDEDGMYNMREIKAFYFLRNVFAKHILNIRGSGIYY